MYRGIVRYVEMSTENARCRAAEIIDRIRRGEDPVPPAAPEPTVADLAGRYMTVHVEVNCRPATVDQYRRLPRLHILPELGGGLVAGGTPAADCPGRSKPGPPSRHR